MKIFTVKWPNGTESIISAESYVDLWHNMDIEGDPNEAEFAELPRIHLSQTEPNGNMSHEHELMRPKWMRFKQKAMIAGSGRKVATYGGKWCSTFVRKN